MPRRSSSFSCHHKVNDEWLQQKAPPPRRVSFDLAHNTIHILPTLQECREAASLRGKEAHLRRTLNEEMLSDLIIAEIQEQCAATARHDEKEEEEEDKMHMAMVLKGCLKAPPQVTIPDEQQQQQQQQKKSSSKRNKRQKKKNKRKTHGCTIEAREDPFMSSHAPMF